MSSVSAVWTCVRILWYQVWVLWRSLVWCLCSGLDLPLRLGQSASSNKQNKLRKKRVIYLHDGTRLASYLNCHVAGSSVESYHVIVQTIS